VKLRELGWIWTASAAGQLVLAIRFAPGWHLTGLLLVTWTYLALMTREFFCRDWLKARPLLYLWSHMFIMPLVDLYATACDWVPAGHGLPSGLGWFLVVSYCNGLSLELGRKIRAPRDEEPGVETYSVLWGRPRATLAWWSTLALTAFAACAAAARIDALLPAALVLCVALVTAAFFARAFLRSPDTRAAKRIETFGGLWTMLLYLSLGALPLLLR
jgi:4-hydroxybenzoate polyprenyltransferase